MSTAKTVEVYFRIFLLIWMCFGLRFCLTLLSLLLQVATGNKANPCPMDLKVSGSPKHAEEEEATPKMAIEAQPDVLKEQSPSNVVLAVLS